MINDLPPLTKSLNKLSTLNKLETSTKLSKLFFFPSFCRSLAKHQSCPSFSNLPNITGRSNSPLTEPREKLLFSKSILPAWFGRSASIQEEENVATWSFQSWEAAQKNKGSHTPKYSQRPFNSAQQCAVAKHIIIFFFFFSMKAEQIGCWHKVCCLRRPLTLTTEISNNIQKHLELPASVRLPAQSWMFAV